MNFKSNKERTIMFLVLMLGMVVTSMTTTAISNALPVIMADMGISAGVAQWLTSGFTLAAGIMIPATAFLIKRFPNRILYLSAMILYGGGALIAAFAPSFIVLLIARIMQGCGCGILMSFVQVVVLAMYPKERHGFIMGVYGLGCTAAPVIAPTIFGVVIDAFGWHTMFLVFAILAIVDILLTIPFMKNVTELETVQFDILSMLLSGIGFCTIVMGLGNLSSHTLFHHTTGLPLVIGIVALCVFCIRQKTTDNPFLDISVFKHTNFTIAVIINVLLYFVIMANPTVLPMFVQNLRGYSATDYALITLPGSVLTAVFTLLSGKFYDKHGGRMLFNGGMTLMAIGCAIRFVTNADVGVINIGISNALISVGGALIMMPASTLGLSSLSNDERIHGSAIMTTLRQIAGAIGSALGISIMTIGTNRYVEDLGKMNAGFKGIEITYIVLFAICIVGLIIAFVNVKKPEKKSVSGKNA